MAHGFGSIDSGFAVTHEAAPSGELGESALEDPAVRDDLEGGALVDAAYDLDREVEKAVLSMSLPRS